MSLSQPAMKAEETLHYLPDDLKAVAIIVESLDTKDINVLNLRTMGVGTCNQKGVYSLEDAVVAEEDLEAVEVEEEDLEPIVDTFLDSFLSSASTAIQCVDIATMIVQNVARMRDARKSKSNNNRMLLRFS